ncbi:TBC domain-containing protein [Diplocarpon rosae]|nr:TBC domain-containing protein [Diplocarpon rosae]
MDRRVDRKSSPYEGIIGKDLGRSFPGVEMFRDPDGDGQRMLGRVLKCFSLYDHKIGYCQGLGFLVGPLLMHMGDKQAFCVLVRLMEHYDLRSCFLPDLSGLHVRIYQFKKLLGQHLPALSAYLERLGVEPAYVSQWFLSFFAVTCPLPMLFRIYDVVFAEGASETIMRVALSLMRKNQDKIMACTEFEDVMQLLLSRGLWDVYHYNADAFVNEFGSMTGLTIVPGRADTEDESLALASDDLSTLLEVMEGRFRGPPDGRRSSILQTKSQLRDDVVRAKEQLIHEVAKTQDLTRRLAEHQQEIQNLKDQVRDGHGQIRAAHQDKQRLERQMHELKARKSSTMAPDGTRDHDTEGPNSSSGPSGLRGFKLGRSASDRSPKAPTVFNKRTSSLATTREKEPPMPGTSSPPGATQDDTDALVLELVQAKTAEAIAKQEAEEAKSKLESLRKLLGVAGEGKALGHRPTGSGHSILSVGSGGGAGGYVSRPQPQSQVSAPVGVPTTSTVGSGGGGFWGGWGKKAISAEKIPGTGGR